ncbi:MAG: hypothetical protein ACOC8I_04415 [Desulfosalsimonas sp.]
MKTELKIRRMAEALGNPDNEREKLLLRPGLPGGKCWVCKRTPFHAYGAMECLAATGTAATAPCPAALM